MIAGKIMLQGFHILREVKSRVQVLPADGQRSCLVAAGRTAQPQVDPAGIKRFQRAELLGHHQRRMVGQHDAARADPDR